MRAFIDTSSLFKKYIEEEGSDRFNELLDSVFENHRIADNHFGDPLHYREKTGGVHPGAGGCTLDRERIFN